MGEKGPDCCRGPLNYDIVEATCFYFYMSKKLKILIFCIIVILLAGIYFGWHSNILSRLFKGLPAQQEQKADLSLSPVKIKADLPQDLIDDYLTRLEKAEKSVRENPTNLEAWLAVGFVKKQLGDFEGAEEAWLKATYFIPNVGAPYANLGDLYTNFLKDYQKAKWAYEKGIEYAPQYTSFWQELANLYRYCLIADKNFPCLLRQHSQSLNPKIEEIILQGLEKNPDNPDFLGYLASYFRDVRQNKKAIEYYEKLLKVVPDYPGAKEEIESLKEVIQISYPQLTSFCFS